MVGLGDSTAFEGDARPRQSEFWVGQGRFRPMQAGQGCCGLGQGDLGSGNVGLGVDGQKDGLLTREGAVMTGIQLGKGFQPNMGLGKENFRLDLRDLLKLE